MKNEIDIEALHCQIENAEQLIKSFVSLVKDMPRNNDIDFLLVMSDNYFSVIDNYINKINKG